jgi:membrane metallo-endopeptidase-like protein 1
MYNLMSLKEIEAKFLGIGWLELINGLLAPQASVDLNEQINVIEPSFLLKLGTLIEKTPKRVLANYLIWQVAKDSASALGQRIQAIVLEMDGKLMGKKQNEPRWKECLTVASEDLYVAAGALYVRQHFDKTSKVNTVDILENLRKSFAGILKQVSCISRLLLPFPAHSQITPSINCHALRNLALLHTFYLSWTLTYSAGLEKTKEN